MSTLAFDETSRLSQASPGADGISVMLAAYQETVRSILDQSDHPGISAEELELFKSQFRSSAFTCRLKSCPRATLGFETENYRLEHEITHVRKFRCTFPDCHFPPFVSAQALKNHTNKYHDPNPAPISIRDIRAPSAPKRVLARRNEEGDTPMQKRWKKSLLMSLAYSNATQPEENNSALSKSADQSSHSVDLSHPSSHLSSPNREGNFYDYSNLSEIKTQLGISPSKFLDAADRVRISTEKAIQNYRKKKRDLSPDLSPEPWRSTSKHVLNEASRLQNEALERTISSLQVNTGIGFKPTSPSNLRNIISDSEPEKQSTLLWQARTN